MRRWKAVSAFVLLANSLAAVPAVAGFQSFYTDLNLDDCLVLSADDFESIWSCPGYRGFPLWVSQSDLRFYLSYGFSAPNERVAGQTAEPFNHLGPELEWRLSNAMGRWFPVASIARYFTSNAQGEETNEVLVVSQIAEGNSCHIAYVDALVNEDAQALARDAADRLAGTVECDKVEPEIIGAFEAW
ncbi:hypothetical protein GCM10007989_19570 [Devosia pacifica]|uniref:Uncharacterized protein n=1 Tax=Devosia pacifica TaxID=1335967 RepID=A0A918S6K2_9HYPH|nr:hypothetical protein [Devosia pacifica]GHA24006.1 hypothetical protein GCM10007989_19570 [Devosia pacifica]